MSTIYTDIESPELLCRFEVIIELKLGSTDMSIFYQKEMSKMHSSFQSFNLNTRFDDRPMPIKKKKTRLTERSALLFFLFFTL